MSVGLAAVDLTAVAAGATGVLNWTGLIQRGGSVGVRSGKAHLRLFNESGVGLQIRFDSGREDVVPAGAWPLYEIGAEQALVWTALYILPGAPHSAVYGVLYEPGETVPATPVLGNSPIGIGGTVATTTGQSLQNNGAAPGASIIEATPSDQAASSITLNNDGSGFIKVLSANLLRSLLNVVRGNATSGKAAFTLGDSGDTSITTLYGVLGAGSVVPPATLAAGAIPAGVTLPAGQVSAGALPSGVTLTKIASDGGAITSDGAGALAAIKLGSSGGYINKAALGDLIDASAPAGANAWYIKGPGAGGRIRFQPNNGTIVAAFIDSATTQLVVNNGFQYGSGGADDAELQWSDDPAATPPASVVCFHEDELHGGAIALCTHEDCPSAGVISTYPVGIKGGELVVKYETDGQEYQGASDDPHWVPLALEGKVPVMVEGDPAAYIPGQTALVSAGSGRMRAWRPGDRWPRGVVVSTKSDVNRRPLAPGCVLALLNY